ncbi:MAG: hypothetical protein GY694_01315 [Gammaproteobacteria bacterium]|nr:hypothetical protein [Gammaproteobacteria bacterium]
MVVFFSLTNSAFADVWDKIEAHKTENAENEGVEDYIWKEGGSFLPPYPQDSDLLEVAGPPSYQNYQYLIDGKTLSIGDDGVVRYSLVIRSTNGSDNVMFDGLRCTNRQIKNYAYGSTDMDGNKKFIERQDASWKPFRSTGVMGYGPIFMSSYFCNFDGALLSRHEIIQNIKYGKGNVDGLYN